MLETADTYSNSSRSSSSSKTKMNEKFEFLLDLETKKLREEHKKYTKKPESHPKYADEWRKFWERRFAELKKGGKINPNNYDFKSEWIVFWMQRMEEILQEDIEKKKNHLQENLKSPGIQQEEQKRKKRLHSKAESPIYDLISSDESSLDEEYRYKRRRRQNPGFRYESPNNQNPTSSQNSRNPAVNEDPVTFISVCRFLSALESELGVLAPKVLDLMSKALALEKLKPNSSDEEMMTADTVHILEVVKEKLKGLLIANVVPVEKIAAVKKAVQKIAQLVHQTPIKKQDKHNLKKIENFDEISQEDQEKIKLAGEISEALKAQGRENCTAEELEVLVEIFLESLEIDEKVEKKASENDSFDDEEIKILLMNFAELKSSEQDQVIEVLTEMEQKEPERVEALKKFVAVGPKITENENKIVVDDEDSDDYNITDVVSSVVAKVGVVNEANLSDNLLNIRNNQKRWL